VGKRIIFDRRKGSIEVTGEKESSSWGWCGRPKPDRGVFKRDVIRRNRSTT